MNSSEITRNNAAVILRNVRGKHKEERRDYYAWLSLGPLGIGLQAALVCAALAAGSAGVAAAAIQKGSTE